MTTQKLSKRVKDNIFVKKVFYGAINSKGIMNVYDKVYFKMIAKKVKGYRPRHIAIETMNVCNLKCVMCPYPKMSRKKTMMPMELYQKIVDDVSKSGVTSVLLNFYNEPFIDPNLFKRIAYAKQKGLTVSFFSNGSVMTREKANKILENSPDKISFSFDGFSKKTYEKIRRGSNFEKTIGNITYLLDQKNKLGLKKPEICLKLVLMDLNKDEVNDFKKLWSTKADSVEIGTVDNRNEDNLDVKALIKLKTKMYPCPHAWGDMTIMADGKVTFCCIDFDGKQLVGDMNTQTFNEVWDSKVYAMIRNLHLQNKGDQVAVCKNCSQLYRNSASSWWDFK